MANNLKGTVDKEMEMEKELKGIIQSYMDRMLGISSRQIPLT